MLQNKPMLDSYLWLGSPLFPFASLTGTIAIESLRYSLK